MTECEVGGREAVLVLRDGTVFRGFAIGADGEAVGEVVFNTALTGYQEILTDPSYRYQMITFTCPHIGNVGVNGDDVESGRVQVSGVIVRALSEQFSNHRAMASLSDYLRRNGVTGISGLDTRALVRHLREHGAQIGIIASGAPNVGDLVERVRALPSMSGLDLTGEVSTKEAYGWSQGTWRPGSGFPEFAEAELEKRPHVVAMDFGIKFNILRLLVDHGFRVTVVPNTSTAEEVLALRPDGVFLSNGPGDPAAVRSGVRTIEALLGKKPIFGICLGHQLLGLAVGAPTFKLKFGHRGGNHPVRNERTGRVEITVQNHGFATVSEGLPRGIAVTHVNLNDRTIEGLELPDAKAFSVQYHPEASPGPHDARYLFQKFHSLVTD